MSVEFLNEKPLSEVQKDKGTDTSGTDGTIVKDVAEIKEVLNLIANTKLKEEE